jgi:hypothetical protein
VSAGVGRLAISSCRESQVKKGKSKRVLGGRAKRTAEYCGATVVLSPNKPSRSLSCQTGFACGQSSVWDWSSSTSGELLVLLLFKGELDRMN